MIRCQSQKTPFQVLFSNGTFSGVCDATTDKGGDGQGFRPHELLEAALGSCTTMIVGMYATAHEIPLDGVSVTVNLDRGDPETAAFTCEIAFSGDLTEAQREKLLQAARACPVRKTLSRRIVFTEKV